MIGSAVGPYRVISRLGAGGMGEVFLGHDSRLQRDVALKCLTKLPAGDPALRARVLSEARAAARLSHPHIAGVYDVVEHDGQSFIVMEYVTGESLAARLARGPLAMPDVMAISRQLASAVAAAHARGVIHRDLKPGNVQLTAEGTVKVLDFGIAKMMPDAGASTATASATGVLPPAMAHAGTPAYMAPEQLLNEPTDARSDVYSLGLILYEMAAGRSPFRERDVVGRAMAIASGPPPRADDVNPDVPAALGAIIAKALDRRPARRFQSARELERALDAVPSAAAPGPAGRAEPEAVSTPSRRPYADAAAAALLAVLVPGAIGALTTAHFNLALGRFTPFNSETRPLLLAWVVWGWLAVFPSALYIGLLLALLAAGRFVLRLLRLSRGVDHALTTTQAAAIRLTAQIGLGDPVVRANAVAAVGVVAIAGVLWMFNDVIVASLQRIDVASAESLRPLDPRNPRGALYRFVLDVLILLFGLGAFRLAALRARLGMRRWSAEMALVGMVVALLVIMNMLPYRLLFQSSFERVDWAGGRCYAIGEYQDSLLLHCPDRDPPRNRQVRRDDPAVHRLGVVESIFTPAS